MFYEYALDPEVVATWHTFERGRFFSGQFAEDEGRLVADFPDGQWEDMVWARFKDWQRKAAGRGACTDSDESRMLEMLRVVLPPCKVARGRAWDAEKGDWLANALRSHAALPFRAILSSEKHGPHVLRDKDLGLRPPGLWCNPQSRPAARDPRDLVDALGLLLECSTHIVLVDPHFKPSDWHLPVFEAMVRRAMRGRSPADGLRIELKIGLDVRRGDHCPRAAILKEFVAACLAKLPPAIPKGMQVDCCILRQKRGGDKFHNRFVLTERGGIMYGTGLDLGRPGESDDIERLAFRHSQVRLAQFTRNEKDSFHVEERFAVNGTAPLRQR